MVTQILLNIMAQNNKLFDELIILACCILASIIIVLLYYLYVMINYEINKIYIADINGNIKEIKYKTTKRS